MILIVDDFSHVGEAVRAVVAAEGYPCRWIGSGREALAAIREHPRDQPLLVVLDYMIRELSGIDLLRALRDDPATKHVNVIILSSIFTRAGMTEMMDLGVSTWITKGDVDAML